ncbi:hypothetical protein ACHWQZ_G010574 [Mnemiopsis leidyi]
MAVLSNNSSSGIQNEAERYSWAAYHIFVLLSSLIGDSLILYSTFQKDAFRLNKFIVAIIQYIAVCDLAYAVCSVLPSVISLIADTWILGDFMCYVRVYLGFFIFPAEMSLIAVLTTSKLLLLKYPIQSRIWTKNKTYVNGICCLVFVKALSFPLLFLIVDKDDLRFDFRDSLILYASFQKDAFKLNKFIVTVIQYIAVSDLVYATFTVLTGAVSLLADSWVLGDLLCYAAVYMGYFIYITGMSLIAVLTTTKFLLLRFPIRCSVWTEKRAVKVCSLVLIPPLIFPILFLIIDKDDVGFDYRIYTCNYMFTSDIWTNLKPAAYIVTLFIPNMAIVASTIPTLMYLSTARKAARRVKRSVPWQGALTVALTAVVYCVSTLPNFVYHIGESFVDKDPESFFQFRFYRLTETLLMINIMSNFYVYTLTIRSFRRFLLSSLFSVEQLVSRITTSKGDEEQKRGDRRSTPRRNTLRYVTNRV